MTGSNQASPDVDAGRRRGGFDLGSKCLKPLVFDNKKAVREVHDREKSPRKKRVFGVAGGGRFEVRDGLREVREKAPEKHRDFARLLEGADFSGDADKALSTLLVLEFFPHQIRPISAVIPIKH